jgi:hypothetical protein
VSLIITPHPLTLDGQRHVSAVIEPGDTLATVLARHVGGMDGALWAVTVSGRELPPAMWQHARLRDGAVVECRKVAQKSLLAFAIPIALSIYAPGWGSALFGKGTLLARAFSAVVVAAGSALSNKLLGPKQPKGLRDEQASPTYALSGGRNRARPYEPIALLFGELRYTPDYASIPYTMFEGDDQYLYSIFHAGINCGSVSGYRIGKTAIENFRGYSVRTRDVSGMPQQKLQAWGNVDASDGAELVGEGDWVVRRSSESAIALQIDIEGSLYAVSKSKGTMYAHEATIEAQYRLVGDVSWTPFFGSSSAATLTSSTTKPLRLTYTVDVDDGQYDVRVKKVTADESVTDRSSTLTWSRLRTVQADNGEYGGMGRMSLKVQASGQLNGAIDEFSWLATAKSLDYWNGSSWVTATSPATGLSNPGAQILHYARGIYDGSGKLIAGMGFDDAMIDIESLKEFMVWCANHGFRFDAVFDSPISHAELLDTIAAAGMGMHSWAGGKLGVTWVADDQLIGGVVNMATMRARTFAVQYQTMETADGIEYAYYDRDRDYAWKTIRVAAPGVATPLNPARITSVGVTTEAHAAVMARFHLAQSLYQRKDVAFETDLEHLTYRRNSVLMLTHDVTQWGYGGRLHAAIDDGGTVTLELDDIVPAGSAARFIGLRVPGETAYRVFGVQAFEGESRTVTLNGAWPAGVAFPGSDGNPAHDTIWIYDFRETPGYKMRVTGIQPMTGMTGASVSCVPETAEFWTYVWEGSYTPPAVASLLPFGLPAITSVVVTEELQRQGVGYYVELTATFAASGAYAYAQVWGARAGGSLEMLGTTQGTRFSWRATLDDVWTIEVRPFSAVGNPGTLAEAMYSVAGLSVEPDAPSAVAATPLMVIATPSQALDLAGYVVRYNPGTNANWSVGTPLHSVSDGYAGGLVPGFPWPMPLRLYGVNTVMIRAIDTSGNESVVAYDTADFGVPDEANIADSEDYAAASFPGTVTGGTLTSGELLADVEPASDFWRVGLGGDFWYRDGAADFWASGQYLAMTYEATYTPPYDGGTVLIDYTVTGSRVTISYRTDPAGAWQPWPGAYGVTVASSPIYFRITTDAGGTRGVISAFVVRLEMPTLEQTFGNVEINSSGTTLDPASGLPARAWIAIEDVQITPIDDGSGAVAGRLKGTPSPVSGPELELLNSSATAVTGHAFVRVRGY